MKTPPRPRCDPFSTLVALTASALARNRGPQGRPERPARSLAGKSLLDRLEGWLWRARQRDLEQALATAPT